jgi:hypothetical protein
MLHLSVAGKDLHRAGAELLRPFAQNILMNLQVTSSLRGRSRTFSDQLDLLNLEFPAEPSSACPNSGCMKHPISVSIKPAQLKDNGYYQGG